MQRLCSTLHFTHRSSLHIAVFECALVPIQSGECGMTAWVRESSSRVSGQVSPKIRSKLNQEIGQRFSDFGKVWRPIFTICGLRLLDPSARRARVNLLDVTLVCEEDSNLQTDSPRLLAALAALSPPCPKLASGLRHFFSFSAKI